MHVVHVFVVANSMLSLGVSAILQSSLRFSTLAALLLCCIFVFVFCFCSHSFHGCCHSPLLHMAIQCIVACNMQIASTCWRVCYLQGQFVIGALLLPRRSASLSSALPAAISRNRSTHKHTQGSQHPPFWAFTMLCVSMYVCVPMCLSGVFLEFEYWA